MTKTKITYTATDPAGIVHKRTSESLVYTHSVVFLPSYAVDLAMASDKHHPEQDGHNWEYYVAIANGRDPHPAKTNRDKHPEKWTPEQIEEERIIIERRNVERLAGAKAEIAGQSHRAYLDRKLKERILAVEKRRADGHYGKFQNAGWCGRRDLAEKLAAKYAGYGMLDVTILGAKAA